MEILRKNKEMQGKIRKNFLNYGKYPNSISKRYNNYSFYSFDKWKFGCYDRDINVKASERYMNDNRIVLSLLVDNTAGVLARVAGLFSRRGYNIESLTVGVTADPRYSRMTVVSLGDHEVLVQIENQLRKLEDVRDIKELPAGRSVYRELIMVKVRADASQRQAVNAIADIFRATVVDVGKDSLTVMLTGDQSKLDALVNLLEDYEILELARTGLTGLERGAEDIRYLP